jgi:DNA replication and repair protein RecF
LTASTGAGGRPSAFLRRLSVRNLRAYAELDLDLRPGPQLIWGPNAAGKTTLVEAVILLAQGRSHRTSTDAELIRWGADFLRIEGELARVPDEPGASGDPDSTLTMGLAAGQRKKIQVNGVPRRSAALADHLRIVLFGPEDMLLVVGSPGLRRATLDAAAAPLDPSYETNMATYERALAQRNSVLRAMRDGTATADQLRLWDEPLLTAGAAIVESRLRFLDLLAEPLADVHREIAPAEEAVRLSYSSNAEPAAGETVLAALVRRLKETSEKEQWNGSTLVGPHRDDLIFSLGGRELRTFASRGQQRTAILAFKMAQLDLLTARDRRPPLLLLDDVFSELDPDRRRHLVRRIAELPQVLVTTTDPDELDPDLRARSVSWQVTGGDDGARVKEVRQ